MSLVLLLVLLAACASPVSQRPSGSVGGEPPPVAVPTPHVLVEAAPARPVAESSVDPTATVLPATPTITPTPTARAPFVHRVQPGETLWAIAAAHGIRSETIAAANRLAEPDRLLGGQELVILPVDGVVHEVRAGETMHQVAERYGVDLTAILAANHPMGDPNLIEAGTKVVVPGVELATRAAAELLVAVRPQQPPAATAQPAATPVAAMARSNGPVQVRQAPPPAVTARYVAIVDEASGRLLYGRQEQARVAPASTTKIATTIVALERGRLDQIVPVSISGSAMARRDGSSIMGLEPGKRVTLRTLLYGMMLPSGNDAAEQVAIALAGSRAEFVGWMNEKVAQLGLKDTQFANPSGMDAPGHYSSAYDLAMLARDAMQDETFRTLAAAADFAGDGYTMSNLNRLIGSYPGADGVKIGRTPAAGRTMVASATRNGQRVYVSIMRSEDLAADSSKLLDWAWRSFQW